MERKTNFYKLANIILDLNKIKYISKQETGPDDEKMSGWTLVYDNEKFRLTKSEFNQLIDALKKYSNKELIITDLFVIFAEDILFLTTTRQSINVKVSNRVTKENVDKPEEVVDQEVVDEKPALPTADKNTRTVLRYTLFIRNCSAPFYLKKSTFIQLEQQLIYNE